MPQQPGATVSRSYPTATAAVQAQLASAFYGAQALLAAMAIADILAIWQQLDLRDIRSSWPAIRVALTALINDRFGMSVAQATQFYAQDRIAAAITGPPPAVSIPPPSPQLVTATLDSTGPYALLGRIKQAQPIAQAMESTSVVMSGAASRLISNGARQAVLASVAADPEAVAWMRVTAANPCAWCAMLASRVDYKTEQSAGFKAHNHCVPAGTLVQGPSTEAAYRRWHEGELVIVGTAAGKELAITPNHPVLTSLGWVPAGLLKVGDQVLAGLSAQWGALDDPDEQQRPALIEDVWGALGVRAPVGMPVAAKDFHGDGFEGEVSVVGADRFFPDGIKSALAEPRVQQSLIPARATHPPDLLANLRSAQPRPLGALASPGGIMGRSRLGQTLLGRQCGHAAQHDVALAMALDTVLAQHAGYNGPRHAENLGQDEFSLSSLIPGADIRFGNGHPVMGRMTPGSPRFDPPALEGEAERLRVHSDLGRRLAERLAGRVQVSRVSELRRVSFAGHVYNLSTAEGWYEADGIIVSNCRCVAAPVFSKEDAQALLDNGLYQEWKRVTRGYSGKDALNAWRRYWDQKMGRDGIRVLPAA